MKRFVTFLSGGIVAAGLSISAFAHEGEKHSHKESSEGKPVTVQGELIDMACFVTSGGDAKGADHASCAHECMASGVPAGILPDHAKDANVAILLLTNPQPLAHYAGQPIKVEGTAYEDKHAIDVKKLYVKDGDNWKEIQLKDAHHDADHKDADHKEKSAHDHAAHDH